MASACPAITTRSWTRCKFQLFSPAPIYPAMEIARMTGALEAGPWRNWAPNDPFVKIALDGRTPQEAAAALVNGTKLADPAYRKQARRGRRGRRGGFHRSHDRAGAQARSRCAAR